MSMKEKNGGTRSTGGEVIKMKFAKYYNVSSLVEKMTKNEEITYPVGQDKYFGVYVCMDTNDFWICRILKGYDENYETNPDKFLVERNKFSNEDVIEKICEKFNRRFPTITKEDNSYTIRIKLHRFIDRCATKQICKAVILLDDEDGLSNWDCCEANSLEECIDIIDGGFGIEQMVE